LIRLSLCRIDVRAASVERVAASAGEGSMTVQFVHEYLKEFERSFEISL
jgi:hypothetical protein